VALRSVAVVGTGLIGASVALAARKAGVDRVTGWDPDPAHLATAAERGAVEAASDLAAALEGAELAVVAAPVVELPAQVRAVLDASGPGCTVTDVGSTKGGVCAAAGNSDRFVGGHPICGSEARGPEWATAELFEGATWFLTPVAATAPPSYKVLHGFVSALGAVPVAIDPEAHDRLVSVTSHLPHALANVLLNQAGAARIDGHEPLAAAGGSLRDMTRIAGANPRIWVDIFLENRVALGTALAEHRRRIEQVEAALAAGDAGFLARWIGEASANRRRLLETAYENAGALQRLRVHVPDRPGVIAGVAQALGAERINIADFDLQHLSSERGGTLAILVAGEQEAARAAAILEQQGYGVVVTPVLDEAT
jgi:prephenate dehydrogenase